MKIEQKKEIVKELHEKFLKSEVVIVTDYKGLDVMTLNDLRGKLREQNLEYRVAKNSFIIRAAQDTQVESIKDAFKGPVAIAISYEDPVMPAKILIDFAKKNKKLEIKIGVMDNDSLDLDQIKALSALPSKEVLLSKLLSVMLGVSTSFVRTLNAIPVKFLNVLEAIKDKKESG